MIFKSIKGVIKIFLRAEEESLEYFQEINSCHENNFKIATDIRMFLRA